MSLPPFNPYQFVPFSASVPRFKLIWLAGHDRSGSRFFESGRIKCEMTLETPILVVDRKKGAPEGLPSSSLRGMVRAVAEVVGEGCGSLIGDNDGSFKDQRRRDDPANWTVGAHPPSDNHRACDLVEPNATEIKAAAKEGRPIRWDRMELCRTCAMFGCALRDACWQGRVRFSDAKMTGTFLRYQANADEPMVPLYSPKPHHLPFYFLDPDPGPYRPRGRDREYKGTTMAGRKVYLHQDTGHRVDADAWEAGRKCRFSFTVSFENLSPSELGLLVFALDLRRPGGPTNLRHHYGYGKPAGYGSVRISTQCRLDRKGWYEGFDEERAEVLRNTDLNKQKFFEKRSVAGGDWAAFERWMAYPQVGPIRYPTLDEIRGEEE